jgi:hypothetical protein
VRLGQVPGPQGISGPSGSEATADQSCPGPGRGGARPPGSEAWLVRLRSRAWGRESSDLLEPGKQGSPCAAPSRPQDALPAARLTHSAAQSADRLSRSATRLDLLLRPPSAPPPAYCSARRSSALQVLHSAWTATRGHGGVLEPAGEIASTGATDGTAGRCQSRPGKPPEICVPVVVRTLRPRWRRPGTGTATHTADGAPSCRGPAGAGTVSWAGAPVRLTDDPCGHGVTFSASQRLTAGRGAPGMARVIRSSWWRSSNEGHHHQPVVIEGVAAT